MILGLTTANFTLLHVAISLIGIATGFIAIFGMLSGNRLPGWNALFLVTTIATSVTGFFFPAASPGLDPAQIVGILSLFVLAIALVARYGFHLAGSSRWIYVITAVMAQWLNSFVAVVQSFQKIPAVHALAPTQKEPPFLIAQVCVMIVLIVLAALALRRSHSPSASAG